MVPSVVYWVSAIRRQADLGIGVEASGVGDGGEVESLDFRGELQNHHRPRMVVDGTTHDIGQIHDCPRMA